MQDFSQSNQIKSPQNRIGFRFARKAQAAGANQGLKTGERVKKAQNGDLFSSVGRINYDEIELQTDKRATGARPTV